MKESIDHKINGEKRDENEIERKFIITSNPHLIHLSDLFSASWR